MDWLTQKHRDRCNIEPSVKNRKEVIAISVKWQPSWISQNAQEFSDHTHLILNKDPIEGQHTLKTTMYHIFPGQNLFCLDYNILTYLGPWLLLEHRPCTPSLQRLLSWAILSSCFQLSPVCVMSASRSRR